MNEKLCNMIIIRLCKFIRMDIEYVDILTGEYLSSIQAAKMDFIDQFVHEEGGKGMG